MKKRKIALIIILFLSVVGLYLLIYKNHIDLNYILLMMKSYGKFMPVFFIILYSILPVLFMPITPLSLASGALFGPFVGTLYTLLGQIFSATIAFFVSRYLLKDWVDKNSHEKVASFQEKINKYGWQFVLVSRFTPIFPFTLQNHLFGVTKISYKTYILASIPALIPAAFVFTYAGYAGKSILAGDKSAITAVVIAVIAFLALCAVPKFLPKTK